MGPGDLARALEGLSVPVSEELLCGFDGFEDAAVVKVSDDVCIVATVDFITPVVDDPYVFGQIAAANALSDVYAMGARPWFAMNILCFPCKLPLDFMRRMVEGGLSKVVEAGALLVGGHTVDDVEPKYGLCVIGRAHPGAIVRNSGARPGCRLFLTKPLGLGVMATAIKAGVAEGKGVEEAVELMRTLNREAALKMLEVGACAATDVTGFGLLGHALEMARASGVDVVIEADRVPVMEEAFEYASFGLIPAGAYANAEHFGDYVVFERDVGDLNILLFDPQTSGGLLVAVEEERAHLYPYPEIGYVVEGKGRVFVR